MGQRFCPFLVVKTGVIFLAFTDRKLISKEERARRKRVANSPNVKVFTDFERLKREYHLTSWGDHFSHVYEELPKNTCPGCDKTFPTPLQLGTHIGHSQSPRHKEIQHDFYSMLYSAAKQAAKENGLRVKPKIVEEINANFDRAAIFVHPQKGYFYTYFEKA